jgi:hypothetical protein
MLDLLMWTALLFLIWKALLFVVAMVSVILQFWA